MPLVFAAAASHAPGITAWPDTAGLLERTNTYAALNQMHDELVAADVESLILLTSEHWVNFFLDHISAFCIGRSDSFPGPVEPWLNIDATVVPGDPDLAGRLIEASYDNGFEPSFAHEMVFDHGTMVPLHFLTPKMNVPVVPVMLNTLAAPQPRPHRCFALGQIIGEVARSSSRRIGIVATGGMSHDPGERRHGIIDAAFDRKFLAAMAGDTEALLAFLPQHFAAAGAGAFELLSWVALRGAIGDAPGAILSYESAVAWATGVGFMTFDVREVARLS